MTKSPRYRVRNWPQLQHFRERRPIWVKLYRSLLDDIEWHRLDGESAKVLVMLWLLASEDKEKSGMLPALDSIAFRLRIQESKLNQIVAKLGNWLEQVDIKSASSGYQIDALETETETEKELSSEPDLFASEFWPAYPRKEAKPKAASAFRRLSKTDQRAAVDGVAKWRDSGRWSDPKFIPLPASFLNARRWEDEICNVRELAPKRGFVC